MKDFPIVIPPKENKSAEVVHVQATRSNVEFFQRKAVAKIMAQLNPSLQDAAMEICLAPQVYENPGKYRAFGYGRVAGMSPAELSAYMLDVKQRYEEWMSRMNGLKPFKVFMASGKPMYVMPQVPRSVCLRMCQMEESVDHVARSEKIGHMTTIRFLQAGLNEYSIIAGWGNQI